MELLTHDGVHHEIGDGGRLVMMMATHPPLRSLEQTPNQPPDEEQEATAAPYHKMR